MFNRIVWFASTLILLLLTSTLYLIGCRESPAPDTTGMDEFSEYYAGEIFLTEKNRLGSIDSLGLRNGIDSLGKRYHLTPAVRDSLLMFYQDSLPRWESFLTTVLQKLEARERSLRTPSPDRVIDSADRE